MPQVLVKKRIFFYLQSIVVIFLVLMNFGCFILGNSSQLAADQELIAKLQPKKDKFNQLMQMMKEDNLLKPGKISFKEDDLREQGIPKERIQTYQNLFLEQCPGCWAFTMNYDPNSGVGFPIITRVQDFGDKGEHFLQQKRVVWFDDNSRPKTVSNLDYYFRSRPWDIKKERTFTYYRHIEGNWYLSLNGWYGSE